MNWSQKMAEAYEAGFEDGKEGKPSRAAMFEFRACYEQGYKHGRAFCGFHSFHGAKDAGERHE